ncbi:MAG: glycosyltransferase [Desertifilum sp.]|nr:glycosyltransferase [Desertifilum sp.]
MSQLILGSALLSLAIWIGLFCFRGGFWQCQPQLEQAVPHPELVSLPRVCVVIPARNEAETIGETVRSLLLQDYPGELTIILVDDRSTDGTAEVAKATATALGKSSQLQVILAEPLPPGWSGKLWAMQQGVNFAQNYAPDYLLFTDADIGHDPANLRRLVSKATQDNLDLASVMVRLRCESFWERLLIPAFVFFFQKLYPFQWVNAPSNPTAGAAGGCILIKQTALERIGGLECIRQTLIDDCALALAVKSSAPGAKIWLGLSDLTRSLRPYNSLQTIWDMVARTAFTQLQYSPLLLLGTVLSMTLIYLVSPLAVGWGIIAGDWTIVLVGLAGWLLLSSAYIPTLRFYHQSPVYSLGLSAIAFLYTLMTIDSALRHWQGRGGAWKGRVYAKP